MSVKPFAVSQIDETEDSSFFKTGNRSNICTDFAESQVKKRSSCDVITAHRALNHYRFVPPATVSNPPSLGVVRIDALGLIGCSGGTWLKDQIDAVLNAIKRIKRSEQEPDTNPASAAAAKLSQEMPSPSGGSTLSYTSTFVPKSFPCVDPKERRKRLRAMAKEAFPPGKPFLDPYTSVRVTARSNDIAVNKPSFMTATCTVKPPDDDSTLEHIQ